MKTAACLAAILGSAAAFAPAGQSSVRSASVATNAVWDDMYGGVDFRGKEFKYDPLNLAESYKPFLPWFREAEIKHGRTAMLAVMGFIATDFVRIPGEMYSFEAIPPPISPLPWHLPRTMCGCWSASTTVTPVSLMLRN